MPALVHYEPVANAVRRDIAPFTEEIDNRGPRDETIRSKLQLTKGAAAEPPGRLTGGQGAEKPGICAAMMAQRQQQELQLRPRQVRAQLPYTRRNPHGFMRSDGHEVVHLVARAGREQIKEGLSFDLAAQQRADASAGKAETKAVAGFE